MDKRGQNGTSSKCGGGGGKEMRVIAHYLGESGGILNEAKSKEGVNAPLCHPPPNETLPMAHTLLL